MIIVYKSKTGFTERYANKMSQELNIDAIPFKKAKQQLNDVVIFGTRIHAGRADGLKKVLKLYEKKKIKELIVFVTGGTPNQATEIVEKIWASNLTPEQLQTIPHFYLQAGICYEKMGFVDRTLMKLAAKMMKSKEDKSDTEDGFLQAISSSYDITGDEYIIPIVQYVKENYNS